MIETKKIQFSTDKDTGFMSTLRQRVSEYFKQNKISKYGNVNMVLKTLFMFVVYVTPWVLMLTGVVTNLWLFFAMWAVMGLGKAGIGMSVTHDANHGTYSNKKHINKFIGLSMNFIGATPYIWKIQHNYLHHTFTNIDGLDTDIQTPKLLRFSPHQKRLWIHRFQFIYIWFFYAITTLYWMTIKEFIQIFKFNKDGLVKDRSELRRELFHITCSKLFYFTYIMVIPTILMPQSFGIILLGFLLMHVVAGITLSLIFQTAHVMPDSEYPVPDENEKVNTNWAVHQMATTSNYAPRSRVFSWLIGGLNYQVEHHLFTNICHVHYRKLSKIVRQTAKEHGILYHSHKSFAHALWVHFRMIYNLGRKDMIIA